MASNTGDLNVIINTETFTLRDVFAGIVLHGVVTSIGDRAFTCTERAEFCYYFADAMMKEREKTQEKQS